MSAALAAVRPSGRAILAVDLHTSHTKAAVLREGMSLEKLRNVAVIKLDANPYWGANCARLFDKEHPGSLALRVQQPYEAISLSISGIVQNQMYRSAYRGVPSDLKAQCERYSSLPVRMENDAVAWARGATALQNRLGSPVKYPVLAVTLEDCPGAAIGLDPDHSMDLELYFVKWPFVRTNACRGNQPTSWSPRYLSMINATPPVFHEPTGSAYQLLSASSVQWLHSQCASEEGGARGKKIQQIFTARMSAYLEDIKESLKQEMGIEVATVLVGGQAAELLDESQLPQPVHVFNNKQLAPHGVSSNLIPLLGACDGFREASVDGVFPDSDHVLAQLQAISDEGARQKRAASDLLKSAPAADGS